MRVPFYTHSALENMLLISISLRRCRILNKLNISKATLHHVGIGMCYDNKWNYDFNID